MDTRVFTFIISCEFLCVKIVMDMVVAFFVFFGI